MSGAAGGAPNQVVGSKVSTVAVAIPGLSGSPDVIGSITGNGAFSDEFDENTAGVPTGWTAFNAPDVCNTNDAISHLHLRKNATGQNMAGIYKAPPAAPFTVTAKLVDCYLGVTTNRAALIVGNQAPAAAAGTITDIGLSQTSNGQEPTLYSNVYTGYNGAGAGGPTLSPNVISEAAPPLFLRLVVTNANNWIFYWSKNGLLWNDGALYNATFVPTIVGLAVNCTGGSGRGEAFFDWIRFS